ncbi:MAG: SHOCT domain-containing protein [Clostridium sp.]
MQFLGCLGAIIAILLISSIINAMGVGGFLITVMIILGAVVAYMYSTKDERQAQRENQSKLEAQQRIKEQEIKNIRQDEERKYLKKMGVPLSYQKVVVKDFSGTNIKKDATYALWNKDSILSFVYVDFLGTDKKIEYRYPKIEIPIDSINTFQRQGDLYTETNITGGEIKGGGSSLGGAVAGAVIAGGVGAVVGSRQKIESTGIETTNNVIDNRQTILEFYKDDKLNYMFLDGNSYEVLFKLIPEKEINFSTNREKKSTVNKEEKNDANVYDEIKKLAELRDINIITEKEFEEKKQDLLKRI